MFPMYSRWNTKVSQMNCPCGCGYSDRFRTCGFNPDAEFTDKGSVDQSILAALSRQDPVQVGIFTYHLSRGGNVYRMLNEAYRATKTSISPRNGSPMGKGIFASGILQAGSKKNTPMKGLNRYLSRIGVRGGRNLQKNLEDW